MQTVHPKQLLKKKGKKIINVQTDSALAEKQHSKSKHGERSKSVSGGGGGGGEANINSESN